jgi:hypothetical protein
MLSFSPRRPVVIRLRSPGALVNQDVYFVNTKVILSLVAALFSFVCFLSAAAAEELNAQAVAMKQSVTELLQLVGSTCNQTLAVPENAPRKKHVSAGSFKVPTAAHPGANGNGRAAGLSPKGTARRGEIPLDGDFKSF